MDPVFKFLGLLLLTRFLECKISFANRFLQTTPHQDKQWQNQMHIGVTDVVYKSQQGGGCKPRRQTHEQRHEADPNRNKYMTRRRFPKHNALHSPLEASHLACSSPILVWRSQGWCLLSSNGCDEQGFLSQMATYRWCASSQRQWMALRFKMAIPSVLDMVPMAGRIINQKSLWDTTKSASVRLSSGSASGL